MSYAALWCKSNYSFLEGASHPEELVRTAKDSGLAALAITDRDGVYGMVRAHVAAKEVGIKLIIGSEISIEDGAKVVLFVRNQEGYRQLCSLITKGRLRCPKGESRLSWADLMESFDGLTAMIPAEPVIQSRNKIQVPWPDLKASFAGYLYLGYAKHHLFDDAAQKKWVVQTSSTQNLPITAAPQILYHSSERRPLQDVLTCIRYKQTLENAGSILKSNHHYNLKTPEEINSLYSDSLSSVSNTLLIADECNFSLDDIHYTYPTEDLPLGHTVMSWLEELILRGTGFRYPEGTPESVKRQICQELKTIEQLEYGGYFLTMWEIVRFCRESGILCQGRGSAANSIVCYCLDITAIDPVKMDLLFERFLSLERAEPPDIDLDIEHQRREEVIQHMYEKYGRDRAAMVANFIRYRPKSAVRDVGKALGFSSVALERLAKNLGAWWTDFSNNLEESLGSEDVSVADETRTDEARTDDEEELSVDRKDLLRKLSSEILEFPRHLSIHPGGFILGSHPIGYLVPVENATMPDRTVIQWDKYDVEAMNLFKVDLLGLGALTHLDYSMRLLNKHRNIDISLKDISSLGDDPEVFEALHRADTVGVFQIESRAQMAMLPRLKPVRFYDLVIEISIVRPGPISGGMVHPYLRRRSGEEPVVYPHPTLEPILKKTLGVPLFQEQVMKLAVVAADYTPGEADQLRRDMGAWRSSSRLAMHKEKLISRMVKKGIKPEFAEAVYSQIQGFGEYGFPESHAASFALIAYATAWFKVKFPAFFTCGLLNAWPMGFYSPATIVDDAKRHDIPILPIDVTKSAWDCSPEWVEACGLWGVRMGLRYVKGLSRADGKILGESNFDNISSVDEFADRTGLNVKTMKVLTLAGAFDSFADNRRSQLWHSLLSHKAVDNAAEQMPHWGYAENNPIEFESLSLSETINWDYSGAMHSTLGHPLEGLREKLNELGLPDSDTIRRSRDGTYASFAGMVICRQRPGTANGVIFITLEDEFGFVNLIIWQKIYEQYKDVILSQTLLGVRGKIQSKDGTVHLVVDECFVPPVSMRDNSGDTVVASRDFR